MATDFSLVSAVLQTAHDELMATMQAEIAEVRREITAAYEARDAAFATEILELRKLIAEGGTVTPALDPRDVNFPVGIEAVKEWCTKQPSRPAPWSRIYRLAAGVLTESYGGYRLANNGDAFPDTGVTPWAPASMPLERRRAIRLELQKSTRLPNDKHPTLGYGKNGFSVGWLQQIPLSITQMVYGANWGYGSSAASSIAECLDVRTSTLMFCDRIQVTGNTSWTAADGTKITGLDPIMADLLALQQPASREASNSNQYGANMVIKVRHMVDHWSARYFTDAPPVPVLAN